jgi:ABC-type multidrug transport system fused ATPase/permease subunit
MFMENTTTSIEADTSKRIHQDKINLVKNQLFGLQSQKIQEKEDLLDKAIKHSSESVAYAIPLMYLSIFWYDVTFVSLILIILIAVILQFLWKKKMEINVEIYKKEEMYRVQAQWRLELEQNEFLQSISQKDEITDEEYNECLVIFSQKKKSWVLSHINKSSIFNKRWFVVTMISLFLVVIVGCVVRVLFFDPAPELSVRIIKVSVFALLVFFIGRFWRSLSELS